MNDLQLQLLRSLTFARGRGQLTMTTGELAADCTRRGVPINVRQATSHLNAMAREDRDEVFFWQDGSSSGPGRGAWEITDTGRRRFAIETRQRCGVPLPSPAMPDTPALSDLL